MSWLKKIFGLQSSQETKVYCEKSTKTTQNEDNSKIKESKFKEAKFKEAEIDDS